MAIAQEIRVSGTTAEEIRVSGTTVQEIRVGGQLDIQMCNNIANSSQGTVFNIIFTIPISLTHSITTPNTPTRLFSATRAAWQQSLFFFLLCDHVGDKLMWVGRKQKC